jgi:hypothetical protein
MDRSIEGRPSPPALRPCLMLAAAAATAAASPAPAPSGLDLPGVRLGMTPDEWRALPFPGASPARVEPVCSDDPSAPANGYFSTAIVRGPGIVVCGYRTRYGRFSLPQPIELGPKLEVRRLRFTFVKGRLSSIEYRASTNAFNDLTARLTTRYGPPTKLVRDSVRTELGAFPRVRQTWNTSRGQIELVDPVQPFTDLSVRLSTPGLSAGRAS